MRIVIITIYFDEPSQSISIKLIADGDDAVSKDGIWLVSPFE